MQALLELITFDSSCDNPVNAAGGQGIILWLKS